MMRIGEKSLRILERRGGAVEWVEPDPALEPELPVEEPIPAEAPVEPIVPPIVVTPIVEVPSPVVDIPEPPKPVGYTFSIERDESGRIVSMRADPDGEEAG